MIFLGYDEETKGYRCFDYSRRKIIISQDVICDETQIGIPHQHESFSSDDNIMKAFLDLNTPLSTTPSHLVPSMVLPSSITPFFPDISPPPSPEASILSLQNYPLPLIPLPGHLLQPSLQASQVP